MIRLARQLPLAASVSKPAARRYSQEPVSKRAFDSHRDGCAPVGYELEKGHKTIDGQPKR